jgi:hypothetical protein
MISKRQRTSAACATTFTSFGEEVVENVGGGSESAATSTEGEHSTVFADLGDDDFILTALQGMTGGFTAEASVVAPMPRVLGDESSGSNGGSGGAGDASLEQ